MANANALHFAVDFDEKPESPIALEAFLFRGDELVASTPVRDGRFSLPAAPEDLRHARLLIAPAPEKGSGRPTLADLERAKAYEPALRIGRRPPEGPIELAPIPGALWRWWPRCRCRVRGRVVRPVAAGGATQLMPVCQARVHICEVDRLPWVIQRLPDDDLLRLRDDLLRQLALPWPPIPQPDPPPFRFDPRVVDPSPERVARINAAAAVGFDPQPDPPAPAAGAAGLADMVMLNPQPLPPRAALELAPAARAALSSGAAQVVRGALLAQADLLRPLLCRLPWLWWWFRCDELRVVYTDSQGRFDATISYPCFGDRPDIYVWVEYCIGGVWTTVYRPSVPCHTYWDYACGSELTVEVTDPRVPWCADPSPLTGVQLAVLSVGNGVSVSEIQGAAAGAAHGLTTDGRPFGGSLEPHVWFGSGLIPAGITHYLWSYRRLGSTGDWAALDRQVVRHYAEIAPDETLAFKPFALGPDPAFSAARFKIQPELSPGDSWAPMVDARENSASAFFLSHLLAGGDALAGAGRYELKLELFRADGTLVNLTDAGVAVKEATDPAPFGATTVHTAVPAEERLIRDSGGKVVAYRLVLVVDNNPCAGEVLPVSGTGVTVDADCGFYEYGPGASLALRFRASHPNGYATFSFTTVRGLSHAVAAASASGPVGAAAAGLFTRAGVTFTSAAIPVAGGVGASMLEGGCDRAAFASTLYVDALATDGWGELDYLDRQPPAVAFALLPQE